MPLNLMIASALLVLANGGQSDGIRAVDGDWIFVEDRTEGRPLEEQQPSMSARVRFKVEDGAVTLVRRDFQVRMPLDGTPVEVAGAAPNTFSRYKGGWKDGAFVYEIEMLRGLAREKVGSIRTEIRPTSEGMLAKVEVGPPTSFTSVALYRHPQDIAMPAPVKATLSELGWLSGAWSGARGTAGTTTIEERWSPAKGGAMLAVSRTVNRDRMVAFEYLRIIEREGSLVYIAQPNGGTPTEFVLAELGEKRAVFVNPRHDSPQKIVYELSGDVLSATIGYMKGGRGTRFEFKREQGLH